jgi:hypothetical protein
LHVRNHVLNFESWLKVIYLQITDAATDAAADAAAAATTTTDCYWPINDPYRLYRMSQNVSAIIQIHIIAM